jgi:hypothetical protein
MKMRKRRTSWRWGMADSEYAGDLATQMIFKTRKLAREWAKFRGPGRYYAVKLEISWDIKEKDRW